MLILLFVFLLAFHLRYLFFSRQEVAPPGGSWTSDVQEASIRLKKILHEESRWHELADLLQVELDVQRSEMSVCMKKITDEKNDLQS
jgi:hypothetical protein